MNDFSRRSTAAQPLRATMQSMDEKPTPTKMPASQPGEPSRKAQKPPKPRKVEKRQRGRKG